ncbi:MAG: Dam family site-specific DNA-(adenine-N6)-methyltransferase [Desulfobulbaceae bacterium]|nr:Dam family site-specific DNA-(adenine-N6)-methyltransferase [Desulfobulbaceae bacterium]
MSKPFLRWAGSKRKLLPDLKFYWDDGCKRYIEPFMGSSCLFFELEPEAAVLNDINKELVNTFSAIRKCPKAVQELASGIPQSRDNYYLVRAQETKEMDWLARAARFIYLNRFCFNGLYRTNTNGKFNVPYGASKSGSIPTLEHLTTCSKLLKKAQLHNSDFETFLLKTVSEDDFVYLDPPYAVANKRVFRQYNEYTFGLADIARLDNIIDTIDKRGATFVLSYAECPEILPIAKKWFMQMVTARRNISGFADHRKNDNELIISNRAPNKSNHDNQ